MLRYYVLIGFCALQSVGQPLRECPNFNSSIIEKICRLPQAVGPCDGAKPRFYYNYHTQKCEQFAWGGCGGNENNFKAQDECEKVCAGFGECPSGTTVQHCSDPCEVRNHRVKLYIFFRKCDRLHVVTKCDLIAMFA